MLSHSPPLPYSTLKTRAEFLRLNRGQKYMTPAFILRSAPSPATATATPHASCARVGYTVTKKCGNAVRRNRIKRRLRAAVAQTLPHYGQPGTDYVLIARADASDLAAEGDFAALCESLRRALTAAARRKA